MAEWTYVVVLVLCLALTFPLEFVFRLKVYRSPLRLILSLLPVVIIFSIWDAVAVARGYWTYDPVQTLGIDLLGALPLEEVAFFVAIPICAILTFEAIGRVLELIRRLIARRKGGGDRA
ncbi:MULTISPECIES: lycopene cyclase domain-containing protein [Micrococcaceae]|uniref:lycopene cyclase domain-containing protein n=1 Tax=unclassified Kocuria TaxID=2649579 RepID=UPI00101174A5|nr:MULTISPECIES: lycopene cyclase domain-containing protein [unclassified Kocuria]